MADEGRRNSRDRDLIATLAIFWIALLPRLYVAIAWAREPVWDGHYYDFGARRIADGLGYSDDVVIDGARVWHAWCHYPVGYSGFLAIVYRIFGGGPHVGPVANAAVGALLAALVHRLARRALSPWRARAAGLLTALSPGLILYAALLMTEPLSALGLVTTAWLAARDDKPMRGGVLAGIALGLTTLVRPQSLVMAPALALFVRARGGSWRMAATSAAAALGVALAVVAPWTLRNCRVMDGCALVSTNAGWNLAIGSFPRATGRFETLHASDGCAVVTGQVEQDRCWMHAGIEFIAADPVRWIALAPKKLAETFDHESFPTGYLGEADPEAWPEERKAWWRSVLGGVHRAFLVGAALAYVARARRSDGRAFFVQTGLAAVIVAFALFAFWSDLHPFWPLALTIPLLALLPLPGAPSRGGAFGYAAAAVASVAVTHAIFFGEDRYHVVVTPFLALLAAAALRRPARSDSSAASARDPAPITLW